MNKNVHQLSALFGQVVISQAKLPESLKGTVRFETEKGNYTFDVIVFYFK